MLQVLNHLHGPSLDSLQYVHVSTGEPKTEPSFPGAVSPALSKEKEHLPHPGGNTPPNANQDTFSLP